MPQQSIHNIHVEPILQSEWLAIIDDHLMLGNFQVAVKLQNYIYYYSNRVGKLRKTVLVGGKTLQMNHLLITNPHYDHMYLFTIVLKYETDQL